MDIDPTIKLTNLNTDEDKTDFEESLEKACYVYHLVNTKELKKNLEILLDLKNNQTSRPILLFGQSGSQKSLLIKVFSLISSLMNDIQFLTHWIKLDSLDSNSLFGVYNGKKYQEGLLWCLFNAIQKNKELYSIDNVGLQKKEIPNTQFFSFSSELANSELPLERKSSDLDWIVFDNGSLGTHYESLLEMATNRLIYEQNGRKILINSTISLIFEVFVNFLLLIYSIYLLFRLKVWKIFSKKL